MDGGTFDRLTRLLAGRLTRRVGLAGALGALAGDKALDAAGRARERTRRHPGGTDARRHDAEVIDEKKPCGPTAAENKCRKNKDCCTNYCKPPKGDAKTGRCRCIKPGKKCKNGQTCCGGATCEDKTCTPAPTCGATGGACTSDSTCCSGLICMQGACGPCVETVCASGCDFTDVNAAYAAAAAGDTIYIGPGTYSTGIVVTKDITLAACPGVTGVVLQPDRLVQDSDSYYVIMKEDTVDTTTKRAVTLRNLTLQGTLSSSSDEALLSSYTSALITWKIENCALSTAYYGIYASDGAHTVTDTTFTDFEYGAIYVAANYVTGTGNTASCTLNMTGSTVTGCDSYGIYFDVSSIDLNNGFTFSLDVSDSIFQNGSLPIYFRGFYDATNPGGRSATVATITNVTMQNNILDGNAGVYFSGGTGIVNGSTFSNNTFSYGGLYYEDAVGSVTDTSLSGNTMTVADAGAITVDSSNQSCTLTISGSTTVTNNTNNNGSPSGGGVAGWDYPPNVATITGTSTTSVTGNTPAQCWRFVNGNVGASGSKNCNTWT